MRNRWADRAGLWGPPFLYIVLIFHLSSESRPMPVVVEHVWDKLLHLSEYGGLAFLVSRALMGEGIGRAATMLAAVLLTSGYGLTDEWHQKFVAFRTSDIHDWFADTLGAVIGAMAYQVAAVLRTRR